jgi:heavy metal sensor kinase
MRSIRLSLLVYFLVLLALVLGAGSLYVYQVTQQTILAKEDSMQKLVEERYQTQCRNAKDEFDEQLLHGATRLASLTVAQWGSPAVFCCQQSGVIPAMMIPQGYWFMPLWVGLAADSPAAPHTTHLKNWVARGSYAQIKYPQIKFTEAILLEYFQISSSPEGLPLQRSRSLSTPFVINPQLLQKLELLQPEWDDAEVKAEEKPDVRVRRVTLKFPVAQGEFFLRPFSWPSRRPHNERPPNEPRRGERGDHRDQGQGGGRPQRGLTGWPPPSTEGAWHPRPTPQFFIQTARSIEAREAELAAYKNQFDAAMAGLREESQATLQSLRNRLLLLAGIAFVATVAGVVLLVHRGMLPIKRISHAVSQVSAQDFQLRLNKREVPQELTPIVEKLDDTLKSLEHAFAREKQAVADISHELRTPIAALRTTTQVCLKKPRTPEEYRETLESCAEIGAHLGTLVERLLVLARLDAGADKVRPERVDVPELASQCVAMVRPLAEAQGLRLQLERNGPAVVRTDPEKLRDIMTNLLHNAIQYNRPQGSIALAVRRENGHVQLEVRDTGVGIPAKARDHLFERFYRVDPSRQSDTVHAGLGLAIVKGYLDLMGGRIEVESEEGQGSTFRVLLPTEKES